MYIIKALLQETKQKKRYSARLRYSFRDLCTIFVNGNILNEIKPVKVYLQQGEV